MEFWFEFENAMDEKTYDERWRDLNAYLRKVEAAEGLTGVFRALEGHQRANGFVKQDVEDVKRFTYFDDDRGAGFLRIQFNAKRAKRFKGAGLSVPPKGTDVVNGGCFLCRDNVRWQQQGRQIGYEIETGDSLYYALANPFPLLPSCSVPDCDGISYIDASTREGLWDRYYTAAPRRRTRSELRYSDRRLRSKS